jgi:predicted dehydrogenase
MSQKIRVGVVGTSWWTDLMYLPALQSHPQAEVAALCGRNRGLAEEMAAKYKIPKVFTEYQEMIQHGNLDALVIGTPDDLHYEIAMQALDAGLHLLCDKPLALTVEQAQAMYEKARASRLNHMVLFTYRWMPFFQYVHDLIEQGVIGRLYHCEFQYLAGYGRTEKYQWRFDQKRANGILGDIGVHMIDMARWLVGDIERVNAQLGVFVSRLGAEGGAIDPANDSAMLLAKFANGAQGIIQASGVTHLADRDSVQAIRLYGEAGSLEITRTFSGPEAGAVIQLARSHEKQFQILEVPEIYWDKVSRSEPFAVFTKQSVGCRLFIDDILENRPPSTPNFYDGYKAQQVVEAALEAHRTGHSINIENPA